MTENTAAPRNLTEAKVGDMLIIRSWPRYRRDELRRVVQVTKVTPKRLWAAGDEFNRETGYAISRTSSGQVTFPKPGELEEIAQEHAEAAARREAEKAAEREAKRGRTSGFLLAAQEALEASVKERGEDAPNASEQLLAMRTLVWDAAYRLDVAERDCLNSAEALEGVAKSMRGEVEGDREYSGSNYQALVQSAERQTARAAAVRHGQAMVRAAAAFLGVTTQELVAPMAKPAEEEGQ